MAQEPKLYNPQASTQYVQQLEQELQLLEEKLSQAQWDIDDRDSLLKSFQQQNTPQEHPLRIVPSFEIGFGAVEQQQLLEQLSMHASSLSHKLVKTNCPPLLQLLQQHKHQDLLGLYTTHFSARQAEVGQVVTQHVLLNEAINAVRAVRIPASLDVSARVNAVTKQLPPTDAQPVTLALHQLECALQRALYQALQQTAQPAGAPVNKQVIQALKHMLDEAMKVLCSKVHGSPTGVHARGCLLKLVHKAMQVMLLVRSQACHAPLQIMHGELVGQQWNETLMEMPVREIPWCGDERLVLACTRPGIVINDTRYSDGQQGPCVLVKSQVVVLSPDKNHKNLQKVLHAALPPQIQTLGQECTAQPLHTNMLQQAPAGVTQDEAHQQLLRSAAKQPMRVPELVAGDTDSWVEIQSDAEVSSTDAVQQGGDGTQEGSVAVAETATQCNAHCIDEEWSDVDTENSVVTGALPIIGA